MVQNKPNVAVSFDLTDEIIPYSSSSVVAHLSQEQGVQSMYLHSQPLGRLRQEVRLSPWVQDQLGQYGKILSQREKKIETEKDKEREIEYYDL